MSDPRKRAPTTYRPGLPRAAGVAISRQRSAASTAQRLAALCPSKERPATSRSETDPRSISKSRLQKAGRASAAQAEPQVVEKVAPLVVEADVIRWPQAVQQRSLPRPDESCARFLRALVERDASRDSQAGAAGEQPECRREPQPCSEANHPQLIREGQTRGYTHLPRLAGFPPAATGKPHAVPAAA